MSKLTLAQIARLDVTVPTPSGGQHESTLRAYQILERTKDWLRRGVPPDVLLELIEEMETKPQP